MQLSMGRFNISRQSPAFSGLPVGCESLLAWRRRVHEGIGQSNRWFNGASLKGQRNLDAKAVKVMADLKLLLMRQGLM